MKKEIIIGLSLGAASFLLILYFGFQYRGLSARMNTAAPLQTVSGAEKTGSGSAVSLTLAEVAKHNSAGDCWIVIEGNVYEATGYLSLHPGGAARIIPFCGSDATTAFVTKGGKGSHSGVAVSQLSSLLLGKVNSTAAADAVLKIEQNIKNMPTGSEREDENDD